MHAAGTDVCGVAGTIVEDPLRARFFRIPHNATRILHNWTLGKPALVAQSSGAEIADVEQLLEFLDANRLLKLPSGGLESLLKERKATDKSVLSRIVHGYLSFRLPLFNPTKMLDALLPLARPLAHRRVVTTIVLIGIIGFYFALRQWDLFKTTFLDFFSLQGAALFGVTLVLLKIFHELGHGLVARHYRCRVPMMGVAFMIMTPMLFTEVSDAWRLKDQMARFRIAAAGVAVELALACLALFFWAFLPDGPWRSAAFFVATTAWITGLLVNLSPFMRFDGYHMMGDALGMYAHGPRAFALATWQIRRALFGLDENPPERLPATLSRFLVLYAWATMIYRLILFGGIALLVYHMFPKAVGLPLAAVEVIYFILLPVWREIKNWRLYGMATLFQSIRARINLAILLLLMLLACLPLSRSVTIPAVMVAEQEAWIFPPEPGDVEEVLVHDGDIVKAGDPLIRLSSERLAMEIEVAEAQLSISKAKLNRVITESVGLTLMKTLERERLTQQTKRDGVLRRRTLLTITAPVSGRINALAMGLQPGQSVGRDDRLVHIAGQTRARFLGLAGERDATRLKAGAAVHFIAEDGVLNRIDGTVAYIGLPEGQGQVYDYLAATTGGPIPTTRQRDGQMKTGTAVLPVVMETEARAPQRVIRGTITATAIPQSLAEIVLGRIVTILRRESGF